MEKNLLALSLICMLAVNAHSQPLAANCFEEYYTLFKSRGAKPVSDGDQKIVIATKSGGYSSCFLGKIAVKNGEIEFPVYVEKVDGSYEIFKTELSPALTHAEKGLDEVSYDRFFLMPIEFIE